MERDLPLTLPLDAGAECAAEVGRCAAQLVELDADAQQLLAVPRVTDVRYRGVVGRQRVRQHAHADAARLGVGKGLLHVRAGHEIGRDDQQVAPRQPDQLQQAFDHRLALGQRAAGGAVPGRSCGRCLRRRAAGLPLSGPAEAGGILPG